VPGRKPRNSTFALEGRFVWREKRIIHISIFLDRVRLGYVVAVNVEIAERSARQHLFVVKANPLLSSALPFSLVKLTALKLRAWIGRNKFRARHSSGS